LPPSLQAGGQGFESPHVHQSFAERSIIYAFGYSVSFSIWLYLGPIKRSSTLSCELHKNRPGTRRYNSEYRGLHCHHSSASAARWRRTTESQNTIDNPLAGMTKCRSELGIAPSPMGIYGIDIPDSFLHPFPHFSRSRISPLLKHGQFVCALGAQRRACGCGGLRVV